MTTRALVLSGGGARGAWQAGAVQALLDSGRRYDIIAGVSVGALNGALLAQADKDSQPAAAKALSQFWHRLEGNHSIYKPWFPLGVLQGLWTGSMYHTGPLDKLVRDNLSAEKLANSGVRLYVGAVCLETGEYRYIEGNQPHIHDWILASASFPTAFPPRKIAGQHWVDGGARDITPVTDVLGFGPDAIDVVMTGHPQRTLEPMDSRKAANVLEVGLRTATILADEVFATDLDRVPPEWRARLNVYCPPISLKLPDPLDFNPVDIARLYTAGYGFQA